ncbi:MAG: hypothetical protein UZ13_00305 [Chloroflexi bacterium OLB13]|jgi:hypothetical protein|nr:MAG: hypothetical protein UZ13_00305 [Chloroflexi bacterium OLB13]
MLGRVFRSQHNKIKDDNSGYGVKPHQYVLSAKLKVTSDE